MVPPQQTSGTGEPCKYEVLKKKCQNVTTESLIKTHTAKRISLSLFLKVQQDKGAGGNRKPSLPASGSPSIDAGTSEVHWLACWPITYRKVASPAGAGLDSATRILQNGEETGFFITTPGWAFSKVLNTHCLVSRPRPSPSTPSQRGGCGPLDASRHVTPIPSMTVKRGRSLRYYTRLLSLGLPLFPGSNPFRRRVIKRDRQGLEGVGAPGLRST